MEGVQVETGGKLYISAMDVDGYTNHHQAISDGRIEFIGVDKYGVNPRFAMPLNVPENTANDYIPLLEDGKKWHYNELGWAYIHYPDFEPDAPKEQSSTFILDGTKDIDGKTYHVLRYDGFVEAYKDIALAYLREDVDEGKVWWKDGEWPDFCEPISYWLDWLHYMLPYEHSIDRKEEFLLYDFKTPSNSSIICPYKESGLEEVNCGDYTVEAPIFLKHTPYSSYRYAIVNGVGLVCPEDYEHTHYGTTLLGVELNPRITLIPDPTYYSFLYKVTNANGEVIYYDDRYMPGCTGVASVTSTTKMQKMGDMVMLNDCREATVYDFRGIVLGTFADASGKISIDTSSWAPGIYMVRTADIVYKIAVK